MNTMLFLQITSFVTQVTISVAALFTAVTALVNAVRYFHTNQGLIISNQRDIKESVQQLNDLKSEVTILKNGNGNVQNNKV